MNFQSKLLEKIRKIFSFYKPKQKNYQYKSSTTKRAIGANYSVEFTQETKKKIEELEQEVKSIVKAYFKNPEGLIKYLEHYKFKIYRLNNAEKRLKPFNEEEGFIIEKKGLNALSFSNMISFFVNMKLSFSLKTEPMFVFDTKNVEIYTVARALYKYYGYKNNLPGYDYRAQTAYKKVKSRKKDLFKGMSPQDVFACKEALSRDMESINFTINLSVEFENAKKAAKKITNDGGANI